MKDLAKKNKPKEAANHYFGSFFSVINQMDDYLERTASVCPDKIALKNDSKTLTYIELNQYVTCVASFLQTKGIKQGERVICCTGNTWQTAVIFWAVIRAGGVVSIVTEDVTHEKLTYILKDSDAKLLFTDEKHTKKQSICEYYLEIGSLIEIVSTDPKAGKNTPWLSSFDNAMNHRAELRLVSRLDIDLAAIIYTSGSTGESKGVMLTHRNMITATESLNAYLGYHQNDNLLCVLPLSFDYGLYQMIMAFSVGATLVLERNFSWPILTIEKIQSENITIFPIIPTIVLLIEECAKKFDFDFSSIRLMSNTGAEINTYHLNIIKSRFQNAKMFSMYGLTECKRCSYLPPDDLERKPGSVGKAIPNTEIFILDDDGKHLSANETGEIVVRGGTVMKGYWKKPKETAQKLKSDSTFGEKLLYTGDLGMLDDEGYLYFKGRKDEMLKCRGKKVSPRAVESHLMSLNGIKESAVLGVSDAKKGTMLIAYVSIKKNNPLNVKAIKAFCTKSLPAHERPEEIVILENLPKTTNGKINKQALNSDTTRLVEGV